MKTTHLLLAGVIVSGFLAACSAPSPPGEGGQMASTAPTPAAMARAGCQSMIESRSSFPPRE